MNSGGSGSSGNKEDDSLLAARVLTSLYQSAVKKGLTTACPVVRKGLEIVGMDPGPCRMLAAISKEDHHSMSPSPFPVSSKADAHNTVVPEVVIQASPHQSIPGTSPIPPFPIVATNICRCGSSNSCICARALVDPTGCMPAPPSSYQLGNFARSIFRRLSEDLGFARRPETESLAQLPPLHWSLQNCVTSSQPSLQTSSAMPTASYASLPALSSVSPTQPVFTPKPSSKASIRNIISAPDEVEKEEKGADAKRKPIKPRGKRKREGAPGNTARSGDKVKKLQATAPITGGPTATENGHKFAIQGRKPMLHPQHDKRIEQIRSAANMITTGGPEEVEEDMHNRSTEDVRVVLPNLIELNGYEDCKKYLQHIFDVCPDFTVIATTIHPEQTPDKYRVDLSLAGTHAGLVFGLIGTGRRLELTAGARVTFRGDRFCEIIVTVQHGWKAEIIKLQRALVGLNPVPAIQKSCAIM